MPPRHGQLVLLIPAVAVAGAAPQPGKLPGGMTAPKVDVDVDASRYALSAGPSSRVIEDVANPFSARRARASRRGANRIVETPRNADAQQR